MLFIETNPLQFPWKNVLKQSINLSGILKYNSIILVHSNAFLVIKCANLYIYVCNLLQDTSSSSSSHEDEENGVKDL